MLKTRLIPTIMMKNDLVVQSYGFERFLPIGKIDAALEFFTNWDVDEIVILDITATPENRSFNFEVITKAISKCFIPLTVGGGMKSLTDIERALKAGADKISINTALFENPKFVTNAALKYGSQCITASVDARRLSEDYYAFVNGGSASTKINIVDFCKRAEDLGAGEILLNSIDRDGTRLGYDIELIRMVVDSVNIPVICCGGVGRFGHLAEGVTLGGAQAVAAGNIFQHTEHSTIAAKAKMIKDGLNVRLGTSVKYNKIEFDFLDRPL